MRGSGRSWETIVVDDGGGDFGAEPLGDPDTVRLVRLPENRGKGAAVAAGMLAAGGRVRIFTDVDLPYGLDQIPVMADAVERLGFHAVIGDRTLPGSRYAEDLPAGRRIASALFTQFVGRIVTGGFHDTQCGLKGVRGDVADALFPLLRVRRFAFDVELVYVLLKHRADIHRMPVRLLHNETSSVRLPRDAVHGLADVLRIKLHQVRGDYDAPALARLLQDDRDRAAREARERWGTQVTAPGEGPG